MKKKITERKRERNTQRGTEQSKKENKERTEKTRSMTTGVCNRRSGWSTSWLHGLGNWHDAATENMGGEAATCSVAGV